MGKQGFSRRRRGVRLTLGAAEAGLLDNLLGQLLELLEPEGADALESDDPLAEMVGIGTATQAPDDPALARLLPDAYRDDAEAAAEFRRYTEVGLREQKLAQAAAARRTLSDPALADGVTLTAEDADAWLRTLNDIRLTLGTRLDVTEDYQAEQELLGSLPPDDPRLFLHDVYDWLGYLQSTLLHALG